MARLSVYIPDELLVQARERYESANVSQIVQSGLRLLVGSVHDAPAYVHVPEGSSAKLLELLEHFLPQAQEDYRTGYEVAQSAASYMPLHALDELARSEFDVARWIARYRRGYGQELVDRGTQKDSAITGEESEASPNSESVTGSVDCWKWLTVSATALGNFADPIGFDEYSFTPSHARVRGYADALREVWSELEARSVQQPHLKVNSR